MISSLLSPTSQPQPRISQLLPSVKCSTCHQPVPLAELGDHTCTAPPPVPSLPKPAITPEAAAALLPGRLQGRVASPSTSAPRAPPSRPQDIPQHQRIPSAGGSRLQINTRSGGDTSPTQASFQIRSSPLARSDSDTNSPRSREPPFPSNASSSPLNTRMRTPSNAGSMSSQSTPSTARPLGSFSGPSSRAMPAPPGPPTQVGLPFPSQGPLPPRARTPASSMSSSGPPPAAYNNNMPPPSRGFHQSTPSTARSLNSFSGSGGREMPNPPLRNGQAFPRQDSQPLRTGSPASSMSGYGPPSVNNRPPPPPGNGNSSISFPSIPGPPLLNNIPSNGLPRNMGNPPSNGPMGNNTPSFEAFVPIAERDIDTKTGGAAGMAGVGRRGFAAAARAAMFVAPNGKPSGPQPQYGRRPNAPQFLDIDAVSRSASTPPLSAGSGYSSPSPGPLSPIPQVDPRYPPQLLPNTNTKARTPSPSNQTIATPTQTTAAINTNVAPVSTPATSSPLSGRLPFFEKLRGRMPAAGAEPSDPLPPPPSKDDSYTRSENIPVRSISNSTNNSRTNGAARRPPSPVDSESEYGGLAYADSTDYEDDGDDFNPRRANSGSQRRRSRTPPPAPLSAAASILQRGSSKTRHMQFGSVSARSRSRSGDRGDSQIGGARAMGAPLTRENSVASHSSYSSDGSDVRGRPRTNSSVVAQALGLSQTPPSDYKRLGGPGIVGRSESRGKSALRTQASGADRPSQMHDRSESKSSVSMSSAAKQRVYGTSIDSGRGAPSLGSSASVRLPKVDTSMANNDYGDDEGDSVLGGLGGSKAQRSRTVQGLQSPEAAKKPIKLPMRSLTSPSPKVADKALVDVGSATKKRVRTCLRCSKTIDNGRWVSVDGGGVLCEKCWKNMYLPKCRRCNLPIEKAAVSSSDGQLKGKYHKECFNCHTCHKPFPDKTFYVYDGKPLCAYHYHEANDSLCAAALCGQPIEGPCAVSHSGDRYHPEHMTCEYPGYPSCREQLSEYWEVDGRMLCERHAHSAARNGSDEEDEEEWVQTSRAKKRVTRFIDLAGAAGPGGAADNVTRI